MKLNRIMKKLFWPYLCNMFVIRSTEDFKMEDPKVKCNFVPITLDNCHRVEEFREATRISEYKEKLIRDEIGFFAECDGKMVGSVWATINKTQEPRIVQTFKKVMFNEALFHDTVVSEKFRGMRVGSFLDCTLCSVLFKEYGVRRVMTDVKYNNRPSMRMLEKVGLRPDHRVLYLAVFGKPILKVVLKRYV